MRFDDFYFKESIDWNEHIRGNEELKYGLELMKKIQDLGYEALIVGGFVRDLLLGEPSDDIDLTTNAPEDVLEKNFDTIDIGQNKQFGVSVIKYKGYTYEVAQYRQDLYGDLEKGKGADKVEIAKDFKDDSSRRDFTINALGIDADGNIVDHHGGIEDIDRKVIAAVGDADIRFKEDEVRQLRGIRFASRLDFDISPETLEAMKKHAPEIAKVAPERITKELKKMAKSGGKELARAIEIMDDVGILQYILPEIAKMKEMKHSEVHHSEGQRDKEGDPTVFGHTLEALKSSDIKDDIVNLAILFHDVGKIVTHTIDGEGLHRYLGHASKADQLIDSIAQRLSFDKKTKKSIQFAAINHMKMHDLLKMSNNKIAQLMDNDAFDILVKVAEADAKSRGKMFDEKEWNQIVNKIAELKERFKDRKAIESIKKVVNGLWVMQLRNIKKGGPEVGRIINTTVEWILNHNIDINDTEKIAEYIRNLK